VKNQFVIAIAIVGVVSLFPATSASAGPNECPYSGSAHNLCLWNNGDWYGTIWRYNQANYHSDMWWYVGDKANDQAGSIFNDREHTAWVGRDWTGSGPGTGGCGTFICTDAPTACLVPMYSAAYLGAVLWPLGKNAADSYEPMNNRISSFDLLYSATTCPTGKTPPPAGGGPPPPPV
jgi:hypothetical protein